MATTKELVLKAIVNDEFSESELRKILSHSVDSLEDNEEEIINKYLLGEAMKTIASLPIVGGPVNDSTYGEVMEEIENMRQNFLHYECGEVTAPRANTEAQPAVIPETAAETQVKSNSKPSSQIAPKKKKKGPSEKQLIAMRLNAEKARAAKAKKSK